MQCAPESCMLLLRMSRECKRGPGSSFESFLIGRLTVNPGPAGSQRDTHNSVSAHRTLIRPVRGNKDLYGFSGPCTKLTYSCSARQNPYEFFLHEYVNFVHGPEKPYSSLSTKIYIFMQCASKSFGWFSSLRAGVSIGRIRPIDTPPYRPPNTRSSMAGVLSY